MFLLAFLVFIHIDTKYIQWPERFNDFLKFWYTQDPSGPLCVRVRVYVRVRVFVCVPIGSGRFPAASFHIASFIFLLVLGARVGTWEMVMMVVIMMIIMVMMVVVVVMMVTPGPTGFTIAGLCASWRSWLVLSLKSLGIVGISIAHQFFLNTIRTKTVLKHRKNCETALFKV